MSADARRRGLPALGPRGEGWVALQTIAIGLVAVAGFLGPRWPAPFRAPLRIGGWVLGLVAAALVLGGFLRLGRQLTPFPKPVNEGSLIQGGVYRLARHPIYGGVLLLSLAWSMTTSPLALVPSALLALLFAVKSRREEAWLVEEHAAYEEYRRRVRWRFIPFLW
jgi:protein-S-isoprenylcysteine O-methyltransferase Ste14